MDNELITIIVPVYKVEKYIDECISSILNQTYSNIEVILIDDGSPDNCSKICDEYASKDNRIKVFHKKNGGVSDARNYGIEYATGEYLMFIDSDDYIESDMVEILYKNLIKYKASISTCGYQIIKNNQVHISKKSNQLKNCVQERKEDKVRELLLEKTTGNYVWNKLYKKSLFKNIKYKKAIKFEDIEIMYRLFIKADRIVFTTYNGYYYRKREKSIMNTLDEQAVLDLQKVTNERYNYIKNNISSLQEENIARKCYTIYRYHILLSREKNKKIYFSKEMQEERKFFNDNYNVFKKKILNLKDYEKFLLRLLKINPKIFYFISSIFNK